jgi:dipeptidyl aminopeptidase/acylaminoacyl peptidase
MPWDESRLVRARADGSGVPEVVAGGPGVSVAQPRPGPGHGSPLAHLRDEGGWLNVWVDDRHLLDEPFEHGDPTWGAGQRQLAWSPDGTKLACTRNERGFGRLCVVEVQTGEVVGVAKGVHGGLSWVGDRLAAIRSGARTPHEVVVYDTTTWERTVVARGPVGGFEEAGLVEPEAVTWEAEPIGDGPGAATVHGRLYRPDASLGAGAAGPPMIVWVHGGPTGQWPVGFNPRIAYFVARGWAVLVPDHRGSTGHGRAYTQAMRGRWCELDTADVAAGIRHAGKAGWCDPRRVAIMGGSAGGATVLNVLADHPDLCAAGVDLFGVTDLFDLDETTHRFEAHYLWSIVGPLPEAAEVYRDRSPVQRAGGITAPLLVLQGTDDVVVPPAQSQAVVERLRAAGRTVEHHLYPGEGHGWNRPEVVADELERIESFLRRHVLRWRAP